jgi:UDP-galactopyranose mutase
MSRMAKRRPVLYIEEPIGGAASDTWERRDVLPGLHVYRPRLRGAVNGFDLDKTDRLVSLLEQMLTHEGVGRHTAWLYTPQAFPMANALASDVLAYDCMDELANFKFAAPQLPELERLMLRHADVVFTGGPSLYRAKKDLHPNVYCFPSSVDVEHFSKGRSGPIAPEIARLPTPRFGFFGVIDERFDASIIDAMASAHPEWQIVLVGPFVKIDAESLPRRDNIHYLGSRPYAELPSLLAGWDVCLLPFALNDATKFISPTKTLEYMAAGRPIATTSIRDVVEPYGDVVQVGDGPNGFVKACERALETPTDPTSPTGVRMAEILAKTSWDTTVANISAVLSKCEDRFARRGRAIQRLIADPAAAGV